MLLRDFNDVSESTDRQSLLSSMLKIAHALDFPLVNSSLVVEADERPHFASMGNYPREFRDAAVTSHALRDPVMARLRRDHLPFSYDQDTYVSAGAVDLWEIASPHGYRTGICVAIKVAPQQRLLIGMDRSEPLPRSETQLAHLFAHLQLLGAYCSEPSLRLFQAEPSPDLVRLGVRLTPRERDVLAWTLEGKTAWETGVILSISERTVRKFIADAMRKLNAGSKHQAALKALRLGLLTSGASVQ